MLKWEGCQMKNTCVKCSGSSTEVTPRGRPRPCECHSCVCNLRTWAQPPCGADNRCYGADRIRDLIVLRELLTENRASFLFPFLIRAALANFTV